MPKHLYSKTEQACMDVPQMEENNMAKYRKLSRTSDQRKALLRNQVTALLNHGQIFCTTEKSLPLKQKQKKFARSPKALSLWQYVKKTILRQLQ